MKNFIFLIALSSPIAASAQPSSQVAWTPELLKFVKAGNPQKGKELAQTCNACHGESGISSMAATPSLAGQLANYLFKQLQDYSSGNRENPIMSAQAKTLSKQDAADLANWYASLPPAFQSTTHVKYAEAEKLVKNGDKQRILPPCEVCHGNKGQGQKQDIPALAGQNAEYIVNNLTAFKNHQRQNDIYSRMRLMTESLTKTEIEELGFYYQNISQ